MKASLIGENHYGSTNQFTVSIDCVIWFMKWELSKTLNSSMLCLWCVTMDPLASSDVSGGFCVSAEFGSHFGMEGKPEAKNSRFIEGNLNYYPSV